jgi:hypothetical protein
VFADLMDIALKNPDVKEQLVNILSLESNKRKTLLDVLLHHTALQIAPVELQTIFTRFLDDDFAQEVLQLLQEG